MGTSEIFTLPSQPIIDMRARRRELELTQADVAARLRRSRGALGHWEIGHSDPSLTDALAYAHVLGGDLVFVRLVEVT